MVRTVLRTAVSSSMTRMVFPFICAPYVVPPAYRIRGYQQEPGAEPVAPTRSLRLRGFASILYPLSRMPSRPVRSHGMEKPEPVPQLRVDQEVILHSLPCVAAQALEPVRVGEHARNRVGNRADILRITDHLAIDAAAHLLARATRAGVAQYWSTLPHRLGDGEAEALTQ